jgi:hypothetical protein
MNTHSILLYLLILLRRSSPDQNIILSLFDTRFIPKPKIVTRVNYKEPPHIIQDTRSISHQIPTPHRSLSARSELTPSPQLRPKNPERYHTNYPQSAQACQHRDALPDPEVDKKRPGVQDTAARHSAAHEIVAGEQRGGVLWIGQRDVDEYALED